MKAVLLFLATLGAAFAIELQCGHGYSSVFIDWKDMVTPCVDKMRGQIQAEINASMTYLSMGAHFSRDDVNRPGFAKYFFESASEERDHAIKLIHYLLMRGEFDSGSNSTRKPDLKQLINTNFDVKKQQWKSGVEALEDALALEASVTKSIRDVIISCEDALKFNDYHLVDYLTGEFLEEQYKGQRELAGRISTLNKLMKKHGPLGEFLFDKTLLNEAI